MISAYELMEQFIYDNNILLLSDSLPSDIHGYYHQNCEYGIKSIILSSRLDTTAKRICVLAEEIEHFLTTPVDLFCAPKYLREKYEKTARYNAVKKLMPFEKLIDIKRRKLFDIYEFAEHLNITVEFLLSGLNVYKERYGNSVSYKDYIIYFDPFNIEKAC